MVNSHRDKVSETKLKLVQGHLLPQVTWRYKFGHSSSYITKPSSSLSSDSPCAVVSFFLTVDSFFLIASGRFLHAQLVAHLSESEYCFLIYVNTYRHFYLYLSIEIDREMMMIDR